jgi:hypothetical protein
MTFPTPHIGDDSRHGLFFTRRIINPMLNLLKRTMTYPGFKRVTFGLAASIAKHYTIQVILLYRKRTRKVHLNIFDSVNQNPRVKGLSCFSIKSQNITANSFYILGASLKALPKSILYREI